MTPTIKKLTRLLMVATTCLIPIGLQANDIDPAQENYTAFKAATPIELDGDLSEWGGANVIENPRFVIPKGAGFEGAAPADIVTHEELGGIWEGPEDQAVDVRVLYDDENVYLGLVVTDDYHEHADGGAWNGDGVQLMTADADRSSQVSLVNVALGGVEEDEPADNFIIMNEAGPGGADVVIIRDTVAKTTTYEICMPIEVVGVDELTEGVQFGLGFAINDGDADFPGQKGWVGWGPHCVVFGKTPGETGLVTLGGVAPPATGPRNYQEAVRSLNPTFYYELNETGTTTGAADSTGHAAAPGEYNGDYDTEPGPMVGIPGPLEVFGGIAVPGVGGSNLAHLSNNAGHITLGPGEAYGANAMTVALFIKAGQGAQGGDRVFTNNLEDPTKSFQIVIGNNGLVLAVDPSETGEFAERTLYLEDNSGHDLSLLQEASGWFHVIASTEGADGEERASNLRIWVNGVDRTENLVADVVGWGTDTEMAKIGGRRDDPTDTTTHSGGQDEVAIWLDRVLTVAEAQGLWQAAITPPRAIPVGFQFTAITKIGASATLTWESKGGASYAIDKTTNLAENEFLELADGVPSDGESTTFTDDAATEPEAYYRVRTED